jgi:HPt (histidine-containing phosphotransfer) domain-containing protein
MGIEKDISKTDKRRMNTMDLARMAEKLGLDKEECAEIVALFIETTLSDLDILEAAIQTRDFALAVQSSHSIKGASANLGFDEISSVAKGVEMDARQSSLEGAKEAAVLIRDHVGSIKGSCKP